MRGVIVVEYYCFRNGKVSLNLGIQQMKRCRFMGLCKGCLVLIARLIDAATDLQNASPASSLAGRGLTAPFCLNCES